jgi:hypothetical protein
MQRELVRLFLDEARLLRYLQHPNIAATCGSGRVFGTGLLTLIDFGLAKARVTSERPAVDRSRRSL